MFKERDCYIDYIRGIAAVLVVMGHSIMKSAASHGFKGDLLNSDVFIFYRVITSVQMPLFMFISGLTLPHTVVSVDWLRRKTKQLIIPFLVWIFIPRLFTHYWKDFIDYIISVYRSPDCAYWFLWSLFLNHLIFYFSRKVLYCFFSNDRNCVFSKSVIIDLGIVALFGILPVVVPFKLPLFIPSIQIL